MRVHARVPQEVWRAVLADDPRALPEHTPEWVDAVCAASFRDATRLYEFGDGRRFVLPLEPVPRIMGRGRGARS